MMQFFMKLFNDDFVDWTCTNVRKHCQEDREYEDLNRQKRIYDPMFLCVH